MSELKRTQGTSRVPPLFRLKFPKSIRGRVSDALNVDQWRVSSADEQNRLTSLRINVELFLRPRRDCRAAANASKEATDKTRQGARRKTTAPLLR